MRKGNRILSGLLALVMTAVMLLCPAAAISYEPDFTPTSKAVYLENLDTGLILYEKNADEKMYPASLTKIMTAIVVLENVKDLVDPEHAVRHQCLAGRAYRGGGADHPAAFDLGAGAKR